MRKIRFITCFLTAVLMAAAFSGCGDTAVKTMDVSSAQGQGQPGQDQPGPQKERGTIAKVVALDGDRLTVIPADMPEPDRTSSEPAFDADKPELTPGAEGPGMPGDGRSGPDGREITFTGKEISYPLSPNVTIEKGTGKDAKEIDLSGLAVNDVIRFTTTAGDDGTEAITSIAIMDQATQTPNTD